MFTLCKKCTEFFKMDVDSTILGMCKRDDRNTLHPIDSVDEVCTHTDEERKFIAVVDTAELRHALDRGYKVHFRRNLRI